MRSLTETEKKLVEIIGDQLYTVEFLEEWINKDDVNVFNNAPASLQVMGAMTFLRAVSRIATAIDNPYSNAAPLAMLALKAELAKDKGPNSYYAIWKATISSCIKDLFYCAAEVDVDELSDQASVHFLELLLAEGEKS